MTNKFCVDCDHSLRSYGEYDKHDCWNPKVISVDEVTGVKSGQNVRVVRSKKCLGEWWEPKEVKPSLWSRFILFLGKI
jgi:hypothetical protein